MSSNRTFARMYRQGSLIDGYGGNGNPEKFVSASVGTFIAIRNTELPPVAEYEAFVSLQLAKSRGSTNKVDGRKLRRMTLMRRNGCSFREIADTAGINWTTVRDWLNRLPIALGGEA